MIMCCSEAQTLAFQLNVLFQNILKFFYDFLENVLLTKEYYLVLVLKKCLKIELVPPCNSGLVFVIQKPLDVSCLVVVLSGNTGTEVKCIAAFLASEDMTQKGNALAESS